MDIRREDIPDYCIEILSAAVVADILRIASPEVRDFLNQLPG